MRTYICIDIGGTAVKHGVLDETLQFLSASSTPSEAWRGGSALMDTVKKLIGGHLQNYPEASGICISTAGMVDCERGEIFHSGPQIPDYTGMQVRRIMEDTFHLPCEVENDVNCAGLAEAWTGAAKDASISLCLTVGTGIGGCIIMDKKVFHGYSGSGCEVGYMHLPGGAFQDLGAATALVRDVASRKNLTDPLNGRQIFELAKSGDDDCTAAIGRLCDVLGMGIANICYVLNPEIVVLGGGIMAQKEYLYDRIRSSLDHYLIPAISSRTRLAFAENQNNAGMLGAYFHFRSVHKQNT